MPSTAFTAQGSTLTIGAVVAAKTLTAITQASPGLFTSTAHGLLAGAVVVIATVVGMTQVNGLVGVVRSDVTANTFTLGGINTTAFTAYGSGGTATGIAAAIGNMTAFPLPGGAKAEIDVTNLNSTNKEYIAGNADLGTMTVNFDVDGASPSDQGQQALRSSNLCSGNVPSAFVCTLPNGRTRAFNGFVKQYGETSGVDQKYAGTAAIRIVSFITYG